MSEVTNQQVFDLLCEVLDDLDRLDAKLDENLVLLRTINYEAELWRQRIDAARASYRPSKEALSP
ncbi:hypothetical protein RPMA_19825 [Tardiphaga alba]|uniref:Uncharacterized protein n=1 Tax=Tardiphaga alba TaxID=340268 RepID=A0ABX8AC59_9BRAD|nr:hypothetical protein [Tardiphaga alba]QUS40837.1 hypothetical protein RPMA_19825 [Tardiphaga alba]